MERSSRLAPARLVHDVEYSVLTLTDKSGNVARSLPPEKGAKARVRAYARHAFYASRVSLSLSLSFWGQSVGLPCACPSASTRLSTHPG